MLSFRKYINLIKEQQGPFYITPRQVIYRRYGKEVADDMINKVRASGRSAELEKQYVLPDYSDESLDQLINVVTKDLGPMNATGYYQAGEKPYMAIDPTASADVAELQQHKRTAPVPYPGKDVLGHETTHSLQNKEGTPMVFLGAPLQEIAPLMGDMKRWYYQQTGIPLDANMSDDQYNQFLKYMEDNNVFENIPYGKDLDLRKILNSPSGKEAFKQIVKSNTPSITTA